MILSTPTRHEESDLSRLRKTSVVFVAGQLENVDIRVLNRIPVVGTRRTVTQHGGFDKHNTVELFAVNSTSGPIEME